MGSDVDALFKLPLGEFTAARNALVSALKKAGQQTEAVEAKALLKPSVSAWVVNQLYWRHGYLFGRLFDAGERLRLAQTTRQASSLQGLVNARREVVAALTTIAADILRGGDYSDTRDVMRRVTSTLEALSAYGSLPGAPSAGRLTGDLEPPGFETLAALQLRGDAVGRPASEIRPSAREPVTKAARKPVGSVATLDAAAHRREARRLVAAARSAVTKAERQLGAAREQVERAAAKLKAAAAHAKKTEGRRAELQKRFAETAKEAEAAHENARAADGEVAEATRAAASAERELQLARSKLEQLAGK